MLTKRVVLILAFLSTYSTVISVRGAQDNSITESISGETKTVELTIDAAQVGSTISPQLFGHNLEHTRKAIWRGISAQMVANRKFAATDAGMPMRWHTTNGEGVSLDEQNPFASQFATRQRLTTAVLMTSLVVMLTLEAVGDDSRPKPNILIVVADDLGWGHVGWQNPIVKTPHLDRLAGRGVKLDHHYVAPVCSPTRVSLMTGRYWSRFGVLGPLRSEPTSTQRAMPEGTTTIATVLKESGYRTALIGKWHLGAQVEDGPERFGFDHFYGIRVGGCTPLSHKWLGMGPSVLWDNQKIIETEGHITDVFGNAAVDWLSTESDRPNPVRHEIC